MTDRSFFTDDEWAALSQAPLHVTMAVVAVAEHGPISLIKEASATAKSLAPPGRPRSRRPSSSPPSPTRRRATTPATRPRAIAERSPDEVVDEALAELQPATAAIAKLPIAEAAEVRAWLIDLANNVAGGREGHQREGSAPWSSASASRSAHLPPRAEAQPERRASSPARTSGHSARTIE